MCFFFYLLHFSSFLSLFHISVLCLVIQSVFLSLSCTHESCIFVGLTGVMNNTHTHTIYCLKWLRKSDITKSVKWKRNCANMLVRRRAGVCKKKRERETVKSRINVWMCVRSIILYVWLSGSLRNGYYFVTTNYYTKSLLLRPYTWRIALVKSNWKCFILSDVFHPKR